MALFHSEVYDALREVGVSHEKALTAAEGDYRRHADHSESWSRRFLRAFPPIPDRVWLGFFLLMVFGVGIMVGLTLGMPRLPELERRASLQHQLDALDARVRALEQR